MVQTNISFRSMVEAYERRRIARSSVSYPALVKENRITIAREMTVWETSIWIWTLGYSFAFEAQFYAKSFYDNEINGSKLPMLTLYMLEVDLGIHNRNHCMAIKRQIDIYFPGTNENQFRGKIGIGLGELRQGSLVSTHEFMATSTSMRISSVSVYDVPESVLSNDASFSIDSKISSTVPIGRCLVLTLPSEQKVPLGCKDVKSQFAKFDYNVEIASMEKDNSYILVFDNEDKALQAYAQFKNFGYELSKYRPRRPSPDNQVFYKVFSPCPR